MARFVLVTLGITAMYVGLQQTWLSLSPLAELIESRSEGSWPQEAATVASVARDADHRLPPEWRVAAFRLGYHVGYLTELFGFFAMAPEEARNKVRTLSAERIKAAEDLALVMGVGPAAALPVTTVGEFGRVEERIEQDELGLAARVEQKASVRHRHLLLLGMHLGVATALADMSGGKTQNPLRQYIGHHATVARVPPGVWEPAARVHEAATPEQSAKAYQDALAALEAAIGQLGPLPSTDGSR